MTALFTSVRVRKHTSRGIHNGLQLPRPADSDFTFARKGRRLIYVGNIPNYSPTSETLKLFSAFGRIESSENAKTYNCIAYATREAAERAVNEMNKKSCALFRGRSLRVELAFDRDWIIDLRRKPELVYNVPDVGKVLYCRGLQERSTLKEISKFFSRFGRVVAVYREGFFGFVTYKTIEDAGTPFRMLTSSPSPKFEGSTLCVEWAHGTDGHGTMEVFPGMKVGDSF